MRPVALQRTAALDCRWVLVTCIFGSSRQSFLTPGPAECFWNVSFRAECGAVPSSGVYHHRSSDGAGPRGCPQPTVEKGSAAATCVDSTGLCRCQVRSVVEQQWIKHEKAAPRPPSTSTTHHKPPCVDRSMPTMQHATRCNDLALVRRRSRRPIGAQQIGGYS
jgi:hypothetical protein